MHQVKTDQPAHLHSLISLHCAHQEAVPTWLSANCPIPQIVSWYIFIVEHTKKWSYCILTSCIQDLCRSLGGDEFLLNSVSLWLSWYIAWGFKFEPVSMLVFIKPTFETVYRGCQHYIHGKFISVVYDSHGRLRWLSWMRRPTGDQEVAGSTPAEVGNILSWRLIIFYGHSLPSADLRRAVVSFWRKNVHNTG